MRALLLLLLLAAPSGAQTVKADGTTDMAVPRFVSLKQDKAYLRVGPGQRYPVQWTYVRKGLPVEILREYYGWRQVRDADGTTGWMDRTMLTGTRTGIVQRTQRVLYDAPDVQSRPVWRIAPGAVVELVLCEDAWCRVSNAGRSGFILRAQLWGVYPDERIG